MVDGISQEVHQRIAKTIEHGLVELDAADVDLEIDGLVARTSGVVDGSAKRGREPCERHHPRALHRVVKLAGDLPEVAKIAAVPLHQPAELGQKRGEQLPMPLIRLAQTAFELLVEREQGRVVGAVGGLRHEQLAREAEHPVELFGFDAQRPGRAGARQAPVIVRRRRLLRGGARGLGVDRVCVGCRPRRSQNTCARPVAIELHDVFDTGDGLRELSQMSFARLSHERGEQEQVVFERVGGALHASEADVAGGSLEVVSEAHSLGHVSLRECGRDLPQRGEDRVKLVEGLPRLFPEDRA